MKESTRRIKLAVQMFNFVAGGDWEQIHSQEDAEELLTQLAGAGFQGVEWCNFQLNQDFLDLAALKRKMDELGLETCGLHFHLFNPDALEEDCRTAVERCRILGTDKLILAFSLPETFGITSDTEESNTSQPAAADAKASSDTDTEIKASADTNAGPDTDTKASEDQNTNSADGTGSSEGAKKSDSPKPGKYTPAQIDAWAKAADRVLDTLREATAGTGIRILYHNHNSEILVGTEGTAFLEMIHPDAKEYDVYWISKGLDGKVSSALSYIRNHREDALLLHIKDGLNGSVHTGEMCGWGKGTYPLQSIVDCAKELGLSWVVVENDDPKSFGLSGLQDAKESGAYAARQIDFMLAD